MLAPAGSRCSSSLATLVYLRVYLNTHVIVLSTTPPAICETPETALADPASLVAVTRARNRRPKSALATV
jgi:hypothetical protein